MPRNVNTDDPLTSRPARRRTTRSTAVTSKQTSVAEISLASHGTPSERTNHTIKVRARTTTGSTGKIRAALYEGSTNRSGNLESTALTTTLADYTLAISGANAATITDYSNLSIRIWGYDSAGNALVFEVAKLSLNLATATRVNLATYSATLSGMMTWLAANPQPAYVPAGTYVTTTVINIPAGSDLVFQDVVVDTQSNTASCLRVTGANNAIQFLGVCRIGLVGQRYARLNAASQAGLNCEAVTNTTIHADNLTIEGIANSGVLVWSACSQLTFTGIITATYTGSDTFHTTGGSTYVDWNCQLISNYSGDDGAACVSYEGAAICNQIRYRNVTVNNQRGGRGISVVGGNNVTFDLVQINSSFAAPLYFACEPSFTTLGVNTVTVVSATVVTACTGGIHNTNVQFYSDRAAYTVANVNVVSIVRDPAFSFFAKTGAYAVTGSYVNGVLVT